MNLTEALARIAGRSADAHGAAGAGLDLSAVLAETRRRRRRFAALTTVAAAAAVALIAAGGFAIGSIDTTPVPPATTEPTSSPTSAGWPDATTVAAVPACGDPTPQLDKAADPRLVMTSMVMPTGIASGYPADQLVEVGLLTTGLPDGYAMAGQVPVTYALVAGDRVVSVAEASWSGTNSAMRELTTALFQPCPGVDTVPGPGGTELLTPGAYQLYAVAQLRPQTVDGAALGGSGTLLVAAPPSGVRLGGPLAQPDRAPELPTCGQDASGLAATPSGPVQLSTYVVPAGGYVGGGVPESQALNPDEDSFAVQALVSTAFRRAGQDRVSWVAVQDGKVVAQAGATYQGSDSLAGSGTSYLLNMLEPLSGLVDCRTGAPLRGAFDLWVRADLGLDTAPLLDGTDPTVSLIADSVWATTDPQPVPASVPMVGAGAAVADGDAVHQSWQSGPKEWSVVATLAGSSPSVAARVHDALAAAGFTPLGADSSSWPLDFQGHGLEVSVVPNGNDQGSFETYWTITAQ